MRKSDFLLAQMLSRFVFLVLEVVVILAFGVARLRGADPRLARAARARSPSSARSRFAGLGLLVAARARTLEAANGLMNLVMVPDVAPLGRLLLRRSASRRPRSRSSRRCR